MKRRIKTLIALLLCAAISLTVPLPAVAGQKHSAPVVSDNQGDNEYRNWNRWYNPINSYLISNADGTLTRVEYAGEKVVVETFSADLQFISGFSLEPELPLFGGFYSGETHNFIVFGQENDAEDDAAEVFRVVCYTKDWQRVGADSLYGANTTVPFFAGSLRFAECNGYLYIRTCHEMYASSDGRRHQANVMINFRITDTTITDSFWRVSNSGYGYVSHSFNQFVLVDGHDLLTVDHGDAHPRSVALMRYHAPAGQDSFMQAEVENYRLSYVNLVDILPMAGMSGENDTGVALGGFEASDSGYLIAGNTIDHERGADLFGQRNIFISVTSKEDFSGDGTTVRYLTDYSQGDAVDVSTPHFVKLSGNRFAVLWTEETDDACALRYCFVDGQGNVQGEIYTTSGVLSDCVPVVAGDKLVWYVTSASQPAFFTIDLENPEETTHAHLYTYEYDVFPGYDRDGALISTCMTCGREGSRVSVPALENLEEYDFVKYSPAPTCTSNGYAYYRWKNAGQYKVDDWAFGVYQPELGHDWAEGDCQTPKTCTRCGETDALGQHNWQDATCTAPENCTICGETRGEPLPHDYVGEITKATTCTEDGEETFICTGCGDSYTRTLEQYGHQYLPVVTEPGYSQPGYTTYTCQRCGDSYVADEVPARRYTICGTITSFLTDEEMTVELLADGKVVDSLTLSGQKCDYALSGVPAGDYSLRVSKPNHVPVELAVSAGEAQSPVNVKICPRGDLTGDGAVNAKDYQRLLRHINKTKPLTQEEKAYADLTGDGAVNAKDYQRLLRHINKTKPLF